MRYVCDHCSELITGKEYWQNEDGAVVLCKSCDFRSSYEAIKKSVIEELDLEMVLTQDQKNCVELGIYRSLRTLYKKDKPKKEE